MNDQSGEITYHSTSSYYFVGDTFFDCFQFPIWTRRPIRLLFNIFHVECVHKALCFFSLLDRYNTQLFFFFFFNLVVEYFSSAFVVLKNFRIWLRYARVKRRKKRVIFCRYRMKPVTNGYTTQFCNIEN